MEALTEIYACDNEHNFIVLDSNMDHLEIDVEDLSCPVCGSEVISVMTRLVEINRINKKHMEYPVGV